MECLESHKRSEVLRHGIIWMKFENIVLSRKMDTKDLMLCDSIYMKC